MKSTGKAGDGSRGGAAGGLARAAARGARPGAARVPVRAAALAAVRAAALAVVLAGAAGCATGKEAGAQERGNGAALGRGPAASATAGTAPGGPARAGALAGAGTGAGGPAAAGTGAAASAGAGGRAAAGAEVDRAAYPWLSDPTCGAQAVAGTLAERIPAPQGFERVAVADGSFGRWLRGLPLRPAGPVVDHRGRVVVAEGDRRVAAVAALDEGTADLQQCADSIVRLHAEWRWSRGMRTVSYRAAAGFPMPFEKFVAGERVVDGELGVGWQPLARAGSREDHRVFRKFLDTVFAWANTGSLARDAAKVAPGELRPGDFFVTPGAPGHAVLVLDLAQNTNGERVALLGQGYMPAQSFHVLHAGGATAWFELDPDAGGVQTPFWPAPFPWASLRRLE